MSDELSLSSKVTLNNGQKMPVEGLGVWKATLHEASFAVETAIKDGYLLIDTAKQYGNEAGVGDGIRKGLAATGKKREDLFITTKVFNGDQGYQKTLDNFQGSLDRLGLDYLDLYLIHWPVDGLYKETWQALEKLYSEGKVKSIGVSNFDQEHMDDLLQDATVTPAVDQIEFNPLLQQEEMRDYAKKIDMKIEAWSPLGGGQALNDPKLKKIADQYGKSVAQVILRWDLQSNIITIPKSVHAQRIEQNADIYDFELSDDDMGAISLLNQNKRSLWYQDFDWHTPHKQNAYHDEVDQWPDAKDFPVDYKK
ncbi:oxidoreductase [Lactobacillus selangorensis]|uniref:Oxidoreductase n=1 Tax=Lactobacillus selangorensis TaxID=81857 RepID=A0A0R2FK83_9LACO|nr:aldo/keto reductase [Lactobacillus selangorensis]KRN29027.1 oxidoreductase [Lactobacillus selangorensis]KRN32563.1 oxidoreductase [Lactobacillus selangorensis]